MTLAPVPCALRRVVLAAALVPVAAPLAMAEPNMAGRESNQSACLEQLQEKYGAVETGKILQKRARGQSWVRVYATTSEGDEVLFRCQVRYGEVRGVTSYDGSGWTEAEEVPPAPVEGAADEDAAPRPAAGGGAGAPEPGEGDPGGEDRAEGAPSAPPDAEEEGRAEGEPDGAPSEEAAAEEEDEAEGMAPATAKFIKVPSAE